MKRPCICDQLRDGSRLAERYSGMSTRKARPIAKGKDRWLEHISNFAILYYIQACHILHPQERLA